LTAFKITIELRLTDERPKSKGQRGGEF
jgi:hypothetical protein